MNEIDESSSVIVRIWPNSNLSFFKKGLGHVSLSTRGCEGESDQKGIYISHFPKAVIEKTGEATLRNDLLRYKNLPLPIKIELKKLDVNAIEDAYSNIKPNFAIQATILPFFNQLDDDGNLSTNCAGMVAFLLDAGGLKGNYGKSFLEFLSSITSSNYSENAITLFKWTSPVLTFFAGNVYGANNLYNEVIKRMGNYKKIPEYLENRELTRRIIDRKTGVVRDTREILLELKKSESVSSKINTILDKSIGFLFRFNIKNPLIIIALILLSTYALTRFIGHNSGKARGYAVVTPNDVQRVCDHIKSIENKNDLVISNRPSNHYFGCNIF